MTADLSREALIEKYVAKNAVDYNGKANAKAVIGKILAENPDLKSEAKQILPQVQARCEQINELSYAEQQAIAEQYEYPGNEEQELTLPDASEDTSVVMRLAPFPSGPLHIGNARMAVLNDTLVKRYNGTLVLVIDDTAGSAEKQPLPEAYEMIPQDLKWLNVDTHYIYYKSDRMDIYYQYAKYFLEQEWAYVCQCDHKTLRHNRRHGKACACRSQYTETNLTLWEQMKDGKLREGEASVRLKTDMQDKDPAFRDRVIVRISEQEHPRVGNQYTVWPMLEFSWAIDDYLLGITHILRGKDLMMETRMEQWIWELLDWEQPTVIHHGTLQFDVNIAKSASQRHIAQGTYSGWDDPRTWSIRSLHKRGIQPDAVRQFVLGFGLSNTDVHAPIQTLYKANRSLIDETANRYFFIEQPTQYTLANIQPTTVQLPLHPDIPDRGQRTLATDDCIYLDASDGRHQEVRLKGYGNVTIDKHTLTYVDNDVKRAQADNLPIVHWLPVNDTVEATVMLPNGSHETGLVERHVLHEEEGALVQFERYGFCRLDNSETVQFYYAHR